MTKILIAEDQSRVADFIDKGLRSKGFNTAIAGTPEQIIKMVFDDDFDLMLLDIGLPGKNGLIVLEELRGQGATLPIIILSASDDINHKIAGLEGGADDYVTKPFRFEELLARVRLRLRKPDQSFSLENMIVQVGELTLNLSNHKVQFQNKEIELSLKEFKLLETFVRNRGQILSRVQLLNQVWGYSYDPGSNIVDVYVGAVRKKLASDVIETVRGMGYRFSK